MEIPVVTQGASLDEVSRDLQEAVQLHLEGEDLAELGAPDPTNHSDFGVGTCLCQNSATYRGRTSWLRSINSLG